MSWKARVKEFGMEHVGPRVAGRQPRREALPLSYWNIEASSETSIAIDGVEIAGVIAEHGSPLHVVRGARLDDVCHEALAPLAEGHGAEVFFSYKTNPIAGVLQRIHGHGIGAEVISAYEFWLARRLGVPGERIIYNGPAKSPESIAEAIRQDTMLINANSAGDLKLIEAQAKAVGRPANTGLRVALPGGWGGQFGVRSDVDEVLHLVRFAIESPHLNFVGLHSHRGATMRTRDDVVGYLEGILDYLDGVYERTGWYPSILDVGGSLGCPSSTGIDTKEYRLNRALGTDLLAPDPNECMTIGAMSQEAWRLTEARASHHGVPMPTVVLEPGRALTADTQFLLASVLDVKTDDALPHVVLDAGMNIAESVANEFHQLIPAYAPTAPAEQSYRIVGPICTPADVLYNNWRLPEPSVGDVLAIMDTGAYCVPFSTSFSFPRPAIVELDDKDVRVLRRAETFDDLVARDAAAVEPIITLAEETAS